MLDFLGVAGRFFLFVEASCRSPLLTLRGAIKFILMAYVLHILRESQLVPMNLIVRQSDTNFFHRVVAEVVCQAFPDELAFALQEQLAPGVIQANGFSSREVFFEIVVVWSAMFPFGDMFWHGCLPTSPLSVHLPKGLGQHLLLAICSGRVASPRHLRGCFFAGVEENDVLCNLFW